MLAPTDSTVPTLVYLYLEGRNILKAETYKEFNPSLLRGCVIREKITGIEYICYSNNGKMKVISSMALFCSSFAEIAKEQGEQVFGFLSFLQNNEVQNIKDIVQLFSL